MTAPSIHAFSGQDTDALLDVLLMSQRMPNKPRLDPSLAGRELTPYFGSSEPVAAAAAPIGSQSSRAQRGKQQQPNNNNNSNKRKNVSPSTSSPPSHSPLKSATVGEQRGSASSGRRADSKGHLQQQHQQQRNSAGVRARTSIAPSSPPAAAGRGNVKQQFGFSPPSTGFSTPTGMRSPQATAAAAAASKYYCPGMFSSPKPEHLPMPTGLLQRALVAA